MPNSLLPIRLTDSFWLIPLFIQNSLPLHETALPRVDTEWDSLHRTVDILSARPTLYQIVLAAQLIGYCNHIHTSDKNRRCLNVRLHLACVNPLAAVTFLIQITY